MKEKSFKTLMSQGLAGLFHICTHELKSVFKDQGVLIFFVLVPLFYPLLYAFIYTNEVVREVPAAVVDFSKSSMSRKYLRLVDATPDVHIQAYCSDMEEAKELIKEGKVYGIIYIPQEFSKELATGEQAHVSLFCDMSGMLYYKALLMAATNASLEINKQIKIVRLGNTTERQDEISTAPITYEPVSLFNPQDGFASFLVPAILILVIQQTLVLGIGMLGGTVREENRLETLPQSVGRHFHGTLRIVFGKSLTYLMIYILVCIWALAVVPKLFALPQIGDPLTLLLFVLPYLLACIFFAMTLAGFMTTRESPMLVFVFTSVLFLFISGISWPKEAIPPFWKALGCLFPSTPGIQGFVRINTCGATLNEVAIEYRMLWVQAGIYFLSACLIQRRALARHLSAD